MVDVRRDVLRPPHGITPAKPHSSWEKCDETLRERKNEEIKGRIRSSSLIPVYTIHLPTVHVCTKFQPSSKKVSNDQELKQSDPTSCTQNQKGNT